MNFSFNINLANEYKSKSQQIRVMSESWVAHNIYCPVCGNPRIVNLDNNMPVADFQCDFCGEIYELKSKNGKISKKIADGAYETMINRITSNSNPDLFVMQYSNDLQVVNLTLIPKFLFVPSIIEKRKPLSQNARRAGWVGCNILYSEIPTQGRLQIIKNQSVKDIHTAVEEYKQITKLQVKDMDTRGWLLDVLTCVNNIPTVDFTLHDVYEFTDLLQEKHMDNNNVQAKIRQKLQVLRDKGFIEFLGRGHYRKIL